MDPPGPSLLGIRGPWPSPAVIETLEKEEVIVQFFNFLKQESDNIVYYKMYYIIADPNNEINEINERHN